MEKNHFMLIQQNIYKTTGNRGKTASTSSEYGKPKRLNFSGDKNKYL